MSTAAGKGVDRSQEHDADDAVFKALASNTRRRMLDVLRESSCTTGELCAAVPDLDRTTVLQHLRVLEAADLVTGRKVGRERHLSLAPMPIRRISERWIDPYARAAVDLLDELSRSTASTPTSASLEAPASSEGRNVDTRRAQT